MNYAIHEKYYTGTKNQKVENICGIKYYYNPMTTQSSQNVDIINFFAVFIYVIIYIIVIVN